MKLWKARRFVEREVKKALPDWGVRFFDDVRYNGICVFTRKELWFNESFMKMGDVDDIRGLARHEITHAVLGRKNKGHTPMFKRISKLIGGISRTKIPFRIATTDVKVRMKCPTGCFSTTLMSKNGTPNYYCDKCGSVMVSRIIKRHSK